VEITAPSSGSDDRQDVIAFLSDPAAYGPGVDRVDIIATHISLVFLAGDRAYKLKRAVRYPYLDFSTAERRRRACNAEVALNRRTAPDLYLEVRGVGRAGNGTVGWTGAGPRLDWVVVMRRFDQAQLFGALAGQGLLAAPLMRALVDHVVAFHAAAERRLDCGGAAAVAAIEKANNGELRRFGGEFFAPEDVDRLHLRSRERLTLASELLDARRAAGKVRRCHGDLHLRNICLLDGKPALFDCLEFSEELATIDVLYDVAFLLMDLEHRRLQDLANLAANRYFDMTEEEDGLAALPLFLSLRAAIRAHVTAAAAACVGATKEPAAQAGEARRYLDLARAVLAPQPRRLIAIGGLSGVGKSTIAARLAPALGLRPGARMLRSDVIRKRLCGVVPETPLPASAYEPEMSRRVYQTIRNKARTVLRAGYCVIIDAVSLSEDERRSFAAVAEQAGVPFAGIWLSASPETMTTRLRTRRDDASDASADVLQDQLHRDPGPIDWLRVEVGGDREADVVAVRGALGLPPDR
jgi:uncharacterized protein